MVNVQTPEPTGGSDRYRPGGYLPDADGLTGTTAGTTGILFPCCRHCTHDPDYEPDRHKFPCRRGCEQTVPGMR